MSLSLAQPFALPTARHGDDRIPLRAHFVWFGETFPWVNLLALRSAATRGGFEEVVLHHDSDLSHTAHYGELLVAPRVVLRRLDVPALLARCTPYGAELSAVFGRLKSHCARADLVRLALLYSEGGVYLDMDTVTIRSIEPLCREMRAFVGQEHVVYPARVRYSRNPFTHAGALARSQVRDVLRRAPHGWAGFRYIARWYPLGANNAVFASARRSRFITESIERLLQVPPKRQAEPYAIGPHLLQDMVARYQGGDLAVHPPQLFFPLGPEISEHWFRKTSSVRLEEVLAGACIVHWYASVRSKHIVPHIDPDYVRRHARRQLFSSLALPFAQEETRPSTSHATECPTRARVSLP